MFLQGWGSVEANLCGWHDNCQVRRPNQAQGRADRRLTFRVSPGIFLSFFHIVPLTCTDNSSEIWGILAYLLFWLCSIWKPREAHNQPAHRYSISTHPYLDCGGKVIITAQLSAKPGEFCSVSKVSWGCVLRVNSSFHASCWRLAFNPRKTPRSHHNFYLY
jgi:hypothetical protein